MLATTLRSVGRQLTTRQYHATVGQYGVAATSFHAASVTGRGKAPKKKGKKVVEERASPVIAILKEHYNKKPEKLVDPRTPEELAEHHRIAKEYATLKTRESNRLNNELQRRLNLRQEAFNALPTEELKAEAMEFDEEPFPLAWRYPSWSPPKADYRGGRDMAG
eukprot:GFYU01007014.1.p1 GENE.GFYU01007014.1~~GFYU01007014.1.p1  ORF type:complete len:164 (+),score=38.91 GFYU01007014.1:43-534(+)